MANQTAFGIIEGVFRRNGGLLRLKGELAVYYWPRIAGAELAKKVDALRYRGGCIYLQTENPALAHQVVLLVPEILKRFRKLLGAGVVKELRVKIGPLQPRPAAGKKPPAPSALSDSEQQLIERCRQAIPDPELAQGLVRLLTTDLQNQYRRLAKGGEPCQDCGAIIEPGFSYCPSCERQLQGEITAFNAFLKKQAAPVPAAELPAGLGPQHRRLLDQMQSLKQKGN